jgi:hypothetical protein
MTYARAMRAFMVVVMTSDAEKALGLVANSLTLPEVTLTRQS